MSKKTILCLACLLASPLAGAKTLFCDGITVLDGVQGASNFTIELRANESLMVVPTTAGKLTMPIQFGSGDATYVGYATTESGRYFSASLNRFTGALFVAEGVGESIRVDFTGTCYARAPQF